LRELLFVVVVVVFLVCVLVYGFGRVVDVVIKKMYDVRKRKKIDDVKNMKKTLSKNEWHGNVFYP
jgi:hypothetical protein